MPENQATDWYVKKGMDIEKGFKSQFRFDEVRRGKRVTIPGV